MNKLITAFICLCLQANILQAQPATRSFAGEQLLSGSTNSWEPFIAADPNSSWVYAAWFNPTGPALCQGCTYSPIMFTSSSDNGVTWSQPKGLAPSANSQGQYDITLRVVKNTGAIYATWMSFNEISFSKSTNNGNTWSATIKISGRQWADHPWFGMSADGKDIYAFWTKGDVFAVSSHDFGTTWSSPIKINSDKNRQYYAEGVEVLADGTILATAISYPCSKGTTNCKGNINVNVFRSTNLGNSYNHTIVEQLYTGSQWMTMGLETIASDAAGNLMLMYSGASSLGGPNQMYIRSSTDKGLTWGPRKLISTISTADACYPAIVGGASGNFRAVYYDNRTGLFNVFYRETIDNGATWSTEVRISDKSSGAPYKTANGFGSPYGDYLNISVLSSGETIAVFGEAAAKQAAPGGIWFNRSVPALNKVGNPITKINDNNPKEIFVIKN